VKRYSVTVGVWSTITVQVSAKNKAHAIEKALEEAYPPSLYHQCADELEVGEIDCESVTLHSVTEIK
jgi:hypothetical protein